MQTTATLRLPEFRLDALNEVVVRANRKAAKLGAGGFTVREVGVEKGLLRSTKDGEDVVIQTLHDEQDLRDAPLPDELLRGETRQPVNLVTVEVTGDEPVIEGWRFAATLDHDGEGNIVRQVPGDDSVRVSDWVKAGPDCGHCNLDRRRNKTYLLVEQASGALKQVGSTCIADFLGGHTADQMAKLAETWTVILLAGSEDPDDWGSSYGGGDHGWPREVVVTQAAASIREHGFVSKGAVYQSGGYSTASRVTDALRWRPRAGDTVRPDVPTDEDEELALKVLAWSDDLDPDPEADYLWNLTTALARPVTTWKLMGLVVSAVTAYNRATEREVREAAEAAIEWVKVPHDGVRLELTGTVLTTKLTESQYGTQLKMLLRVDVGPTTAFKLWGSVPAALGDPEVGDLVRFTARVERSRDDDFFGFWSRPTKASVVEAVAA